MPQVDGPVVEVDDDVRVEFVLQPCLLVELSHEVSERVTGVLMDLHGEALLVSPLLTSPGVVTMQGVLGCPLFPTEGAQLRHRT